MPPGGYEPDIIVLLTDGANTRGISPVDAAKQAARRRVRVYTIGFGTDHPTNLVCTPEQLGAGGFDGGGVSGAFRGGPPGGGRNFLVRGRAHAEGRRRRDRGHLLPGAGCRQLRGVFAELPNDIQHQHEEHEISVWFVIARRRLRGLGVHDVAVVEPLLKRAGFRRSRPGWRLALSPPAGGRQDGLVGTKGWAGDGGRELAPAPSAVLLDSGGVFLLPEHDRILGAFDRAGWRPPAEVLDDAHYPAAAGFGVDVDAEADWVACWEQYLRDYVDACGAPPLDRDEIHRHLDSEFADAALWLRVAPGCARG